MIKRVKEIIDRLIIDLIILKRLKNKKCLFVTCLITKKQTTKYSSANFQKMVSPSFIILRIQRLEDKQCRSRCGGSFLATSSRSALFANSAMLVSGTYRVKERQYVLISNVQLHTYEMNNLFLLY